MSESTGQKNIFIAERFREERERLGLSRPNLSTALSVTLGTIKNWEGGLSFPGADDLAQFEAIGGDVLYVITGRRIPSNLVMEDVPPDRLTPAKRAATHLMSLRLADGDADLVIAIAKRLAHSG